MSERESHSAKVTVARPTRKARAAVAGAGWSFAAPIAFVAVAKLFSDHGGPPPFAALLLVAVALPGIAAAIAWSRRGTGEKRAKIVHRSLLLGEAGEQPVVRREDIASAFVSRRTKDRERLDLELHDGERIELDYPVGEADRALHALGLDPDRHATRIPLFAANAPVVHSLGGILLGLFPWLAAGSIVHDLGPRGFFATSLGLVIAAITAIPFALGGYALFQRGLHHAVVGAEGVEFSFSHAFVPRRRHLSFEAMNQVVVTTEPAGRTYVTSVVAHMDDGEKVVIGTFLGANAPPNEALSLRDAVDAARVRYAKGIAPASLALFDTSKDGSWLEGLRELARGEGAYRTIAVTREKLLELVDDPHVAPKHRIAAAFVLKERDDEEGVRRVRVASETTASPRVRVALASIAEGRAEEAALRSAAEGTDDEPAAKRRSAP